MHRMKHSYNSLTNPLPSIEYDKWKWHSFLCAVSYCLAILTLLPDLYVWNTEQTKYVEYLSSSWNGSIFVPQSTTNTKVKRTLFHFIHTQFECMKPPKVFWQSRIHIWCSYSNTWLFSDTSQTAKYSNAIMQPSYFIQKSWIQFAILSRQRSMEFKVNLSAAKHFA